MRKATKRFVLSLVGLVSLAAALASPATAVTWHQSGDTSFTGFGGSSTLGITGVNQACSGSTAVGTSPAGSKVGNTVDYATGSWTFANCTVSGIPTHLGCAFTLTATGTTGAAVSGFADLSCGMTQYGAEICRIEGATPATYHNPVDPSTTGRWTLPASATLRTTHGSSGSCPLGAGEPFALTAQTIVITASTGGATTPHLGPRIARTA